MKSSWLRELWRGKSFGRATMNVLLSEWLQVCRGTWLDIGGGRSPSYLQLIPKECVRVGTDIATYEGVERLDADQIFPYEDARFDGVLALNMLYCVRKPSQTLAEMKRVVKPGGRVMITFPFFFLENPEPHDFHRWTREGALLQLESAGFVKIRIIGVGGAGTAFAMTLLPGRGVWLLRILFAPCVFLLDRLVSRGPVCFWLAEASIPV